MKAQFLKLAGVKNDADFYKKFPTEKAFMAKYGAQVKKLMQAGGIVDKNNNNIPDYLEGIQPNQFQGTGNVPRQFGSGLIQGPVQGAQNLPRIPYQIGQEPGPFDNLSRPQLPTQPQQDEMDAARELIKPVKPKQLANEQAAMNQQILGVSSPTAAAKPGFDKNQAIKTGLGMVDSIVGGIQNLKAEKKALKSARTWRDVSKIARKASETVDVNKNQVLTDNQKRLRKAMMPSITGEELFPVTGVGTNVLAKAGGKLPTGGLSRGKDYGSKSKPYPSVSKGDFAGGGRSYPIPTKEDAGDALRLAGLHGRDDVKAKVYAKYPELRKQYGGEIMNTYDPGDIYQDLGYEPLGESTYHGYTPLPDSEIVKAYREGGLIPRAQSGFGFNNMMNYMGGTANSSPWGAAGNIGGSLTDAITGNNAGGQIGGGIGEAAGSLFGPIGGAVGKTAGTLIGGLVDRNPARTKRAQKEMMGNVNVMSGMEGLAQYWGGNNSVAEDGGTLDRNWQPQVITHFGENSMHKLLDHAMDDMNTLRTGGNIRSNQVGDITIDGSRGKLEPISYNPYTAGTGVTSMIKGPSHDDGGVNIAYNGNMVEAEGGEPITERAEGGSVGDTSAVITGDLTFNKMGAHEMPELSKYVNKKVKNIHNEIAEDDRKLNKFEKKNNEAMEELNPRTSIEKLYSNSLMKNNDGIQEQYKRNALKTQSLIAYQDAINQEAQFRGLNAGELSRGKVKPLPPEERVARNGVGLLSKAAVGDVLPPEEIDPPVGAKGNVDPNIKYTQQGIMPGALDQTPVGIANTNPMFQSPEAYAAYKKETEAAYDDPEIAKQLVNYFATYEGPDQADVRAQMNKQKTYADMVKTAKALATDYKPGRYHINTSAFSKPTIPATPETPATPEELAKEKVYDVAPYKKYWWENLAPQVMPWIRKQPGEPLLGDQLAGEMFAMSRNQEEPVQARFYHPNLDVPYDISLQDQLNQNQADFNAMAKQVGTNPEALAALAAQKYRANTGVLGEQFRLNQAKKDQVYSQNRATLNEAQRFNLGLADQQYVRQQQAKSNTKAVMQEALNSVASKIGQNRLENRTLQTYANMFPDFSYDKNFRIRHTGAPADIDIPVIYNEKGQPTHYRILDDNGKTIGYEPIDAKDKSKKQPSGIPPAATAPITPPGTKTMGTATSTGPTVGTDKKAKRYGGLVKAFKNI